MNFVDKESKGRMEEAQEWENRSAWLPYPEKGSTLEQWSNSVWVNLVSRTRTTRSARNIKQRDRRIFLCVR